VSRARDWLDELPLAPGAPFIKMGVAPLDLADWLWRDDNWEAELALRHELLEERHDEVFAALPGTEAASTETLELVADAVGMGTPDPVGIHPLEAAGRLVQEDLCLMVPSHDGLILGAAVLCFPSHWRLGDKFGRPMVAIHAPVPRYDPELVGRVDNFMTRLRPERPVWRRNWNIHDHDALFAPVPPPTRSVDATHAGDELFVRSERQTLRRLPRTGAVVFTIKTQQVALRAMARKPELCARMAETIRQLPDEHLWGRSFAPHRDVILTWLDAHA
jgi:dimethylamine monooxygenase subunit A